jgi:hypothetical protein
MTTGCSQSRQAAVVKRGTTKEPAATSRGATEVGGRSEMNDEPEYVETFLVSGAPTVEINADRIAQIIFDLCRTSEARAIKAADQMIDYLAEARASPNE